MDSKIRRRKQQKRVKYAKSADEYIRQIKKLTEDYEKCLNALSKPFDLSEQSEKTSFSLGFHDYDEEPCTIRSFMQANPNHKGPIWIVCRCRRCSNCS